MACLFRYFIHCGLPPLSVNSLHSLFILLGCGRFVMPFCRIFHKGDPAALYGIGCSNCRPSFAFLALSNAFKSASVSFPSAVSTSQPKAANRAQIVMMHDILRTPGYLQAVYLHDSQKVIKTILGGRHNPLPYRSLGQSPSPITV